MSHRKERVASALRQQIAEIVSSRMRDPRRRSRTVVEVRPSPDFSFARVFYRTLEDPEQVASALERAKPFIRRCLAEVCELRRVPELDLRLDTSLERGARVESLLNEIAVEREAKAGSHAPESRERGALERGDAK
jgi:ribosome-binding factor A